MNPIPHTTQPLGKRFWSFLFALGLLILASPASGKDRFQYQMYTDVDHHGIVAFPKNYIFEDSTMIWVLRGLLFY